MKLRLSTTLKCFLKVCGRSKKSPTTGDPKQDFESVPLPKKGEFSYRQLSCGSAFLWSTASTPWPALSEAHRQLFSVFIFVGK